MADKREIRKLLDEKLANLRLDIRVQYQAKLNALDQRIGTQKGIVQRAVMAAIRRTLRDFGLARNAKDYWAREIVDTSDMKTIWPFVPTIVKQLHMLTSQTRRLKREMDRELKRVEQRRNKLFRAMALGEAGWEKEAKKWLAK